jgi:hypothetical protein
MTNETIANIAVTVTAAMLATAAVAFTLSGNAPADPAARDLPIISIQAATSHASTSSTVPVAVLPEPPASVAEAPFSNGTPAPSSSAPGTTKPKDSTQSAASGTAAASTGAAATTVPGGGTTAHDANHDPGDAEHEVVHPRVHETDEHGHDAEDPQIDED